MPPKKTGASETLQSPTEDYNDEDIGQALEDLHRAMESLNMAMWRLDGNVNWGEDKVVRKLRRDIHTLRTVVDERSKGNVHLSGYGNHHDRYLGLMEATPNTTPE